MPWPQKLNRYFISFCRRAFHWSPAYRLAKDAALLRTEGKNRIYKCAGCDAEVPNKQKHVDHTEPVIPVAGWDGSWDTLRDRMRLAQLTADGLTVLCLKCHKAKTQAENKERKKLK